MEAAAPAMLAPSSLGRHRGALLLPRRLHQTALDDDKATVERSKD
uniref:OSJNBa0019K04.10 protein n=1 Tax=Oryza sativa subsp. japonica TaxID=39947 RepID=Q7XTY7_ORYSJ|nr:OSJNBa0019K04.10 [Oryza sativa Japonica Group]